ncbi:mitochondrial matrix Mmp37-domain-containing protein [Rhodofomes roseus]|uniref:Phosphatidate cytidylyltransferase, mitochondrial n=1 Tax=Rhodofomes roseus TaxID=34475 RepID=A0ABQ8KSA7_9APHY|nr:mitochondrial matrix Mmp37-domain-containing protein [Rhodofomes roseus]KAH9841627.1 mitochondrial matrix Mmp37-domain-containing protein [Rhodofomes roseus]
MLSSAARTHRSLAVSATRSLATESVSHAHPLPPPPPPSHAKHPSAAKPASRARLNPQPRPARPLRHPTLAHLPPTFGRNQILPVADSTRALLENIVAQFNAPIRYAFAYGSGVFEQDGYKKEEKPMLDFMFAVTHAAHWHSINMNQFPGHYPLHARVLGSGFVSRVEEISPGVWFNTLVPMEGVTIKYGVTTVDNLCSDLLNWRTLYLAGRMHKPIRIIKDDARVRLTQQVNLTSAVRTALLTLPETFTQRELFARIAGFSYAGDVRMALPGENRDKVQNIVNHQGDQFRELYHRLVVALPGVHWPSHMESIHQDTSPHARAAHLRKLPADLLKGVTEHYASELHPKEADEAVYWTRLAGNEKLPEVIDHEIRKLVRYSSAVQTAKGLVSAGLTKGLRYSKEKVGKWWQSRSAGSGSS